VSYFIYSLALLSMCLCSAAADIQFKKTHFSSSEHRPVPHEFGVVNRVRYRGVAGTDDAVVYGEPTLAPDPQKGTLAKPAAVPGAAWIAEPLRGAPSHAQTLGWGDFDGDGSDELLLGWPAEIWKRNPGGQWVKLASVPVSRSADQITISDVNEDGLADIAISNSTLYLNTTVLPWRRHVVARGFKDQTAVAANFADHFADGGRLDVISGDIENNHKIMLFSAPDWKSTVLRSGIRVIQSEALDIDHDGRIDYIASQYHPGLIFWLEHPKDALREPWTFHGIDDFTQGGADGVHGLFLADLDGDGKPELVASSGWNDGNFPDSIVWYRIPADPRNAKQWERFVIADRDAPGFNHYLAVGDVNGDGRLDAATGAKSGPQGNWFAWWEQPVEIAKPWKKHVIATNQPGATNILIADLNGDGKPDFLASRGHGKGVVWFEAPARTQHVIEDRMIGPHALGIADIDHDGDPDVVVCSKDSGILAWFENDGKGNFTEHRIYEDQSAYQIRLVDMDGDGAMDILVAGQESQNVVWYENRVALKSKKK
jgi:VCBS repeat protein